MRKNIVSVVRNDVWAGAIKQIGNFETEFKYIRKALDDITLVLKDCPKHQQRTTDLEKSVKGHLDSHDTILKDAVELKARRIILVTGILTSFGTALLTSYDKIWSGIVKFFGGK